MEKSKSKNKKLIVMDANVIISSLISREGYTQAVLSLLLSINKVKLVIPASIKEEILRHISLISRKSGVSQQAIRRILDELFSKIIEIDECGCILENIDFYRNLVKDETDIPLVIVGYYHRPSFILTYNKADFEEEKLKKENIFVVTPKEILDILGMDVAVRNKIKTKRGLRILRSILAIFKRETK